MDVGRHVKVQRGDQVVGQFDNGYVQPRLFQVFRHFHAYVAAADHNGGDGLFGFDIRLDFQRIGDIAEREHRRAVDSIDLRANRFRAGREHQAVVGFLVDAVPPDIADGDRLALRVYRYGLMQRAHVDAEVRVKALRRLQCQVVLVRDDAADIIRKPAVGKRDVFAPFQQNDFCAFVQPAQPCSRRRAAGYPAYNNCFHNTHPLF